MKKKAGQGFAIVGLVTVLIFGGFMLATRGFTAPTATRFVDGSANGLNGRVRVLCYRTPSADPFADLVFDVSNGNPAEPLPADCSFVATLHEIAVVASGKPDHGPAYTLYHATFTPTDTTPTAAGGDIVIDSRNRLTLFHVVASLGWNPTPGTTGMTIEEMRTALRGTSAYLYNLTEGQMAFGPVNIFTDGKKWQSADIRVLPANDRRPSAFVGGIANSVREYDGGTATTLYTPAEIYLGRGWDGGLGAADPERGRWTQVITGSRTIGHEWSHYALFLYDEYQQADSSPRYCICQSLPAGCGAGTLDGSAMAYQYSAQEYWHQITHISTYEKPICEGTWNWHFHGNTDWKIIADWGAVQGVPVDAFVFPTTLQTQTPTLADDFFDREPGRTVHLPLVGGGGMSPSLTNDQTISLSITPTFSTGRWPFSELYILEGEYENPTRIMAMGRTRGGDASTGTVGHIRLLDIDPADRVRAYVSLFDGGGLYSYPDVPGQELDPLTDGMTLNAANSVWDYALDHRFDVESGLVTAVSFHLKAAVDQPPLIRLCAIDAEIGCHDGWQGEMVEEAADEWLFSFDAGGAGLDELPRFLIVRVVDPENLLERDIVQWLQVSGGVGPGHVDGIAPLADGEVMLNTAAPVAGDPDCHITSYGPARNSSMSSDALPQNRVLVSPPMLVRIEIPFDLCPKITLGQDAPTNYNIILNLGYEQVDVDRLGVPETNLRLMRYFPGSGWSEVQTAGIDPNLNYLIGSIGSDGIYAVGAVVP